MEGERVFWGAGVPTPVTLKGGMIGMVAWFAVLMVISIAVSTVAKFASNALWWTILTAFAVVMVVVRVSLRWRRPKELAGDTQLRLSPRGYAVRHGVGPVEWRPWPRRRTVRWRDTLMGKPRIIVEQRWIGRVVLTRDLAFTFTQTTDAYDAMGEITQRLRAASV